MLVTESRPVSVDEQSPTPTRSDARVWLHERIDGHVAVAVGVAWVVLTELAFVLEPASSRPVPVVGVFLEVAMYALLATMIAGLVMQRRWGLLASLAAAVLATAASIACPVTGHHPFGAWWFGQMACVLALVGLSAVALRRQYSQ